ncbi:Peptidyl-prolyl cis-trans isomerase CWC27 like protein [Eufriesea mexicana]|uniref:Spliceosome-associated protein CWC27 homolog n=1 Tax=Eufriesea mexicana TaxID=516756 RepID=A0A310SSR0_9HYME|nr:Peptidyl-prolyl cis-trans isomerase CWC27 like protein [Eufriesea mexicana]
MRIIQEMENEQLVIVIKVKDKLIIECKCCIKAHMCGNIYRNMEKVKAARIMGLWHMELIGPVKLMLKGYKGNLQTRVIFICKSQSLRVVMKTTVGDIEAELWVKETPKTCRNFIQLCMEGYWGNNIFHTQGGDPTDTGEKLEEALVDENARPFYPPRLIKIMILNNPFSDITPRIIVQKSEEVKDSSKTKTTAVKDFNLLSFSEEAEEDAEESVILNKMFSDKGKSVGDHLTNAKLSLEPAVESLGLAKKKRNGRKWRLRK